MNQPAWWRGAIIYEIYPRSFMDTNDDGIGDLPGITRRMDYLASLGVDALWIAPFFTSPMADFGYDIADYRDVDPLFGTLADFDHLLAAAHAHGLKVMIDQVPSHTSAHHRWFEQSRLSRDNDKADWYVWSDPRPDGTAPNNWLSLFGGPAWQWEPRRGQYYLHNFLPEQPDLNFHHPAVRKAALDTLKFWLERGVDGFRLDSINFCFHDAQLRDNPPKLADQRIGRGYTTDNPYAFQYHYYNNTQPENLAFLEEMRALLNCYPGAAALGEIAAEDSLGTLADYTGHKRLHMGYSFELLTRNFSAGYIRRTVESLEAKMSDGWPCWAISNHDVERVLTRWGGTAPSALLANLLTAMLCSLRGSACIYQGEELGLPESEIAYAELHDPYGIAFWPNYKGRDGCRTPMPWTTDANAGFSTVAPWLPVPDAHRNLAVDQQQRDHDSALHGFRHFVAWRRNQPALRWGEIHFLDAAEPVLAFLRRCNGETLLVAFNLSGRAATTSLSVSGRVRPLTGHGLPAGRVDDGQLRLPAYGGVFARVE